MRIYKTYGPDAIQVMTEKQSWSRCEWRYRLR